MPSITDADHRDLAPDRNRDPIVIAKRYPMRAISGGHSDAHLTFGPQGNTRRRKILLQRPKLHKYQGSRRRFGRFESQTSAHSFYFPFNKRCPALYQLHPPAVLSQ